VSERRVVAIELPGRRRRAGVSLVPFIDVSLILLILFMLVVQLRHHNNGGITVSSEYFNALAEPGGETANRVAPLTLTLGADGTLALWDRRRIQINELAGVLQERAGSIMLSGSATPAIAIAPEADVPLQTLVEVMSIAQSNPFFKTHIIAPKLAAGGVDK
jgi:biopolymer transport protein ExbD